MSNSSDPRVRNAARGNVPGGRGPRNSRKFLIRRIIALAVVAIAVWLIWSLVAGAISLVQGIFGGGTPAPAASSIAQAGSGQVAGAACNPDSIDLQAIVSDKNGNPQASFASGVNPYISYALTNNSGVDCTFDVGAKDTIYTITSGAETIWSSKDCVGREQLTSNVITLKTGDTLNSPADYWSRVYSSGSGCGAEQKPVTAGGASYHLTVSVGGDSAKETSQFILQ